MAKIYYSMFLVVSMMLMQGDVFAEAKNAAGSITSNKKVKTSNLKRTLLLKMPGTAGNIGGSVAWHPLYKKYYASLAGNDTYPIGIFDQWGHQACDTMLPVLFDALGLWYNPHAQQLQTNGKSDKGWAAYTLDNQGLPVGIERLPFLTSQPAPESIGAYSPTENATYFYDPTLSSIEKRRANNGQAPVTIAIHLNASKQNGGQLQDDTYNRNAIVCTSLPGREIGFLNVLDKQIELYNLANGQLSAILKLPIDAAFEPSYNFSYCNNTFWLYDKEHRIWEGYGMK